MNALRPKMMQRAAVTATRRNASTVQGVHNLSPSTAVPVSLLHVIVYLLNDVTNESFQKLKKKNHYLLFLHHVHFSPR